MKTESILLLTALALISGLATPAANRSFATGPQDVLPVRVGEGALSLQGDWKFKYLPSSELGADAAFVRPTFDVAAWSTLPVPGHWELHGFAAPKYKKVDEGTGLYRHTFRVPAAWGGQRVCLRFEGVLYGLSVWVNGRPVGEWASSYNPVTFDVTDVLQPGASDNVLAVSVTTRSKGWEFDTNDCWALSGIYRDVTLFSVPPAHFSDLTTSTILEPDGSARLRVAIRVGGVTPPSPMVRVALRDPQNRLAGSLDASVNAEGVGVAVLAVKTPQLWTAESPSLYRLELELRSGQRSVQRHAEPIGLREVNIAGGVLRLNGTPIKLRGVDHHDIWPDVGRAAGEAHLRRDLELIRAANINFIRTSHYPSHPRFIELCDELGLYVMCEVPFGFGDSHLTDPTYQDILKTRARATVRRDKNRPSVIVWSVGNENPITDLTLETGRTVKQLDPTRPICFPTSGSYFDKNHERFPDFVDLYAPHYPTVSRLREYAVTLTRPVIVTEYAHQLGLASDRVQDEWEIMQASPRLAGGAIWMFQDQGIRRTADAPPDPAKAAQYVWPDVNHYYDTAGTDGMDGLVYSDRTPQVDYWQVRKVYSPVQIKERTLTVKPGAQELTVHAENRHDFRSLAGMTLQWTLQKNGAAQQAGTHPLNAQPHQSETIPLRVILPTATPAEVYALQLRCLDEAGRSFHERVIRIDLGAPADRLAALRTREPATAMRLELSETAIAIWHPRGQLQLNRRTGMLTFLATNGGMLAANIGPHASRRLTAAEELSLQRQTSIWRGNLGLETGSIETEARQSSAGVRLRVRGRYHRGDAPEQYLEGEYRLLLTPAGRIDVEYDYAPIHANGNFLEAGLFLELPATFTEFRWIGSGPFAGYPGKDRLNEFGLHHLTRDDIRVQGNRRDVELAILSSPAGVGWVCGGQLMDLAVENHPHTTVLRHNALVSGRGNKGVGPEIVLRADQVTHIGGKFTLLPLTGDWPPALAAWFGPPDQPAELQRPFFRSFDQ